MVYALPRQIMHIYLQENKIQLCWPNMLTSRVYYANIMIL